MKQAKYSFYEPSFSVKMNKELCATTPGSYIHKQIVEYLEQQCYAGIKHSDWFKVMGLKRANQSASFQRGIDTLI